MIPFAVPHGETEASRVIDFFLAFSYARFCRSLEVARCIMFDIKLGGTWHDVTDLLPLSKVKIVFTSEHQDRASFAPSVC